MSASITSRRLSFCASSRARSTTTWNCLRSPPIVFTSITPVTLRSLGTISQSSIVRSCIGEW
ncbi:MAG: hypothetical protein QM820_41160 [Minicystis sp.]